MSIVNILESELIHLKDKSYRKSFKIRLREIIESGTEAEQEEAQRVLDSYFPKFEFKSKEKEEAQYKSKVLGRKKENIPYIVCKTCGKMTDHVVEYQEPELIREKRKTWKRVIKPVLSNYIYLCGRKRRNRRLFFSYAVMGCLQKKHRLQIKFKAHKTIVEMQYDYLRSRAK